MKVRLRHIWEIVSTNYWFVPSVMTVAAAIAAFVMLYIDRTYFPADIHAFWLYSGGADGAKTLLSTVAGSIITVAGVVFSITIAALTQASSQFGPRLLRNFMRDASNQVVLGTFVATFVYCVLVLRTIHGRVDEGQSFVPQASVTGAVVLSVASVAVLIYFIHHVSMSLQAPCSTGHSSFTTRPASSAIWLTAKAEFAVLITKSFAAIFLLGHGAVKVR